jgi:Rieske Fe-S protein
MSTSSTHSPSVPENMDRRTLFQRLFLGATVVVGLLAAAMFAIPFILFLMGPTRKNSVPWIKLGPIGKFPKGETRYVTFDNPLGQAWDGMTARNAVFVRYMGKDDKDKDSFLVLSVNCAHLGCPVEWFPQSGLFMCPCHGGVYYENGERASGPPPRGLYHCVWEVRDGQLHIEAPHFPTLQNTLAQGPCGGHA